MHKIRSFWLLIFTAFYALHIFSSCTLYKGTEYPKYHSNYKIDIDSILIHQIPSHVELISKGDKAIFDQKLSDSLDNLIQSIIKESFSDSIKIHFFEPNIVYPHNTIELKVINLVKIIEKKNSVENVKLDSIWSDFYSINNHRYVMISQNFGFTRTQKNLRRHSFGSTRVTLLTGRHKYSYIPNSAFRNDIILLLDLNQKNIVFYQHFKGDIDPLDPEWGLKIMKDILENAQGKEIIMKPKNQK